MMDFGGNKKMKKEPKTNEIIEKLRQSPIFAMSLGSKELFHSNFWAWIMEQEEGKDFVKCFFDEIDTNNNFLVKREDKHRDIVIFVGDDEYVIENKIKSYPDKNQLERYKGKSKNFKQGIITGITKPPFEVEGWKFLSYEEIAEKIGNISKKFGGTKREILVEYKKTIKNICLLLKSYLEDENVKGRLEYLPDNDPLQSVRMLDVFRKLKGDDFIKSCDDLKTECSKYIQGKENWMFDIRKSFNHGNPTIEFEYYKYLDINKELNDENQSGFIGVQIEGTQFRLRFMSKKFAGKEEAFKKAKAIKWFSEDFEETKKIDGHETSMRNNPCSYCMNNVYHVYQYFNILEEDKPYDALKRLIKNYLKKASEIIEIYDDVFNSLD